MNDLSCIAGEGALNSNSYAVCYLSYLTNSSVMRLTGVALGGAMEGIYVNNSTYAYLSMRDGDAVAKKFGGVSGNDPDFFLLTIRKFENGALGNEQVDFYLADYRFPNSADDYILNEWTYIDLSSLGNADSIEFTLSSSDVGQFGMNTPAYFCLDNPTTKDGLATGILSKQEEINVSIFPNPTTDKISLQNEENYEGKVRLFEVSGRMILAQELKISNTFNVSNLADGQYYLDVSLSNGDSRVFPFVKK